MSQCKNVKNYIRNEWIKLVNQGKVNISSINEAIILFDASDDDEYTYKPLVDNQKGYFVWNGTLKTKKFNTFIVWDVVENIFYDGYIFDEPFIKSGFAFINIIKKFDNLQYDSHVTVVGEYVDNTEITLVTGETVSLPVLSNCYVNRRRHL